VARQWSAKPSTAVRIRSIPQKMLVRDNKHFFLYLSILNKSMQKIKNGLLIAILFFSFSAQSQCDYTLNNYKHINCYGGNTGEIDIAINNPNASFLWTGPNGFISNQLNLSNLFAGQYFLEIILVGDTCMDSILIEQTNEISADFELSTMCNEYDSADIKTTIWGGTPGYTYSWTGPNGFSNTNANLTNLWPETYFLTIIDTNDCPSFPQELIVNSVQEMNAFMSSVHVICKDDYSGSARVFVTGGTSPFQFQWSTDSTIIIEHDSFSVTESLSPGEYRVKITDDMGCITRNTIKVKSSPAICITVYKVFSPNDDNIHEFWEIENIHLYPEALVQVYDRAGKQVYRRRNYINAEEHAFGGKDQEGRTLPSGTYYYIIDLENEDTVFKGALTIVR
jgi:gliding motility-associated-like protein